MTNIEHIDKTISILSIFKEKYEAQKELVLYYITGDNTVNSIQCLTDHSLYLGPGIAQINFYDEEITVCSKNQTVKTKLCNVFVSEPDAILEATKRITEIYNRSISNLKPKTS